MPMPPIISKKAARAQGLKRYYTGVPCKHGHTADRRVSDSGCLGCKNQRERDRRKKSEHQSKELQRNQLYRTQLRHDVLSNYGGKCACPGCDIAEPRFLGIDHIEGGGRKHRKEIGSGPGLYVWLRNNDYPKDKFRLLCHNCNHSYGHYGFCAHGVSNGKV